MAAGYSHRSAAEKLGVKAGSRLGVIDADEGWELDGRPKDVVVRNSLRGSRDVTIAFVRSRRRRLSAFDIDGAISARTLGVTSVREI